MKTRRRKKNPANNDIKQPAITSLVATFFYTLKPEVFMFMSQEIKKTLKCAEILQESLVLDCQTNSRRNTCVSRLRVVQGFLVAEIS